MYVCVTYDISSTKKRNKVVTLLESYGFRVQKSVFEIELTEPQFNVLKKQLSKILAYHSPITKIADEEDAGEDLGNPEDEDSIKFYILSKVGE